MGEWKGGTGQKIERLYAWIATEADGGEGVVGHEMRIDGRLMLQPLVGADRERIESFREHAKTVGWLSQCPVQLIEFATRTVLEDAP